ncbi:MAG: hypothetical protein H7X93_03120 [Sphingomonadaceae bacterium]|nr:hypothetical protein [Sphingomonadaceae bacterium]
MKRKLCLTALAAFAAPAFAQDGAPAYGEETRIPFADHGGIRDWDAMENDVLLIEGRNDRWYRAELYGPCLGLRFEEALGFESSPGGHFDRFSSVHTRDDECQVRSLVAIPPPENEGDDEG